MFLRKVKKKKTATFVDFIFLSFFFGSYIFFLDIAKRTGLYFDNISVILWSITYGYFSFRLVKFKKKISLQLRQICPLFLIIFFFAWTLFSTLIGINNTGIIGPVEEKLLMLFVFAVIPFSLGYIFEKELFEGKFKKFIRFLLFIFIIWIIFDYTSNTNLVYRAFDLVGQPNSFPIFSGAIVIYILFFDNGRYIKFFATVSQLIILVLSGSRGATASFLISLILPVLFLIRKKNSKMRSKIIIVSLSFVLLLFLLLPYLSQFFGTNRVIGSIESLRRYGLIRFYAKSGGQRASIANEYLAYFSNNPIFGRGYGIQPEIRWDPHNSIIEVMGLTGVIGFVLFLGIMTFGFSKSKSILSTAYYSDYLDIDVFTSVLFIILFIESLFSGTIFGNFSFWFVLGSLLNQNIRSNTS